MLTAEETKSVQSPYFICRSFLKLGFETLFREYGGLMIAAETFNQKKKK
jgi:hypothetical protein